MNAAADPLGIAPPTVRRIPVELPPSVRAHRGGSCWWCGANAAGITTVVRRDDPDVKRRALLCLGCATKRDRTWNMGWKFADETPDHRDGKQ